MNENKKPGRLQRTIAIVLTALMLMTIFAFGIFSLASNTEDIVKSVRFSRAKSFLQDENDTSFFPMTAARIASLQDALGEGIPLKDELGYVNASFQYALGKDLAVQGSEQLLNLPDGQIYALTTCETLEAEAREAAALYEQIDGEIPFLFAYIHPQFYNGGPQLPEAYRAIDTSEFLAEQILSVAREAGMETLDSRTFFEDTDYTVNDLILKTDMHWTTLAALHATNIFAEEINRLTGASLDTSKIALDQFETETYESFFLGEYGQQVGECNSGLDDITLYWPKYATNMTRHSVNRDYTEEYAEGSFKDAIIKWDALELEPDGSNIRGYTAYGLIERVEEMENLGDCEDITILIFRDSYTAPVGSFLSLMAKKVVMVDMRTSKLTAMEYVEQYDPDIVVFSHSLQMYEDHRYDLGVGYAQIAENLKATS